MISKFFCLITLSAFCYSIGYLFEGFSVFIVISLYILLFSLQIKNVSYLGFAWWALLVAFLPLAEYIFVAFQFFSLPFVLVSSLLILSVWSVHALFSFCMLSYTAKSTRPILYSGAMLSLLLVGLEHHLLWGYCILHPLVPLMEYQVFRSMTGLMGSIFVTILVSFFLVSIAYSSRRNEILIMGAVIFCGAFILFSQRDAFQVRVRAVVPSYALDDIHTMCNFLVQERSKNSLIKAWVTPESVIPHPLTSDACELEMLRYLVPDGKCMILGGHCATDEGVRTGCWYIDYDRVFFIEKQHPLLFFEKDFLIPVSHRHEVLDIGGDAYTIILCCELFRKPCMQQVSCIVLVHDGWFYSCWLKSLLMRWGIMRGLSCKLSFYYVSYLYAFYCASTGDLINI